MFSLVAIVTVVLHGPFKLNNRGSDEEKKLIKFMEIARSLCLQKLILFLFYRKTFDALM